jgi:hypothetical protein
MHPTVRFFLALILVIIVGTGCTSGKKGNTEKKQLAKGLQETAFYLPPEIPSRLLPTLVVGVDSCYVFLQPDENSSFFGPLVEGELVKRLDFLKYWIHVWVPRLRVSGWVREHKVYLGTTKNSEQGSVPTELLATVSIVKQRVNIRKAATLRAPIIYRAEQSQEFLLLDEKEGWYQVWLPHLERKAWVSGKVAVKQGKE